MNRDKVKIGVMKYSYKTMVIWTMAEMQKTE